MDGYIEATGGASNNLAKSVIIPTPVVGWCKIAQICAGGEFNISLVGTKGNDAGNVSINIGGQIGLFYINDAITQAHGSMSSNGVIDGIGILRNSSPTATSYCDIWVKLSATTANSVRITIAPVCGDGKGYLDFNTYNLLIPSAAATPPTFSWKVEPMLSGVHYTELQSTPSLLATSTDITLSVSGGTSAEPVEIKKWSNGMTTLSGRYNIDPDYGLSLTVNDVAFRPNPSCGIWSSGCPALWIGRNELGNDGYTGTLPMRYDGNGVFKLYEKAGAGTAHWLFNAIYPSS